MDTIRDKLARMLEHVSVLNDAARVAIAERLEAWLKSSDHSAQVTVRERGFLVMARTDNDSLELIVQKPTFQVDDSPANELLGSPNIGPSVLEADPQFTKLEIPLTELQSE